MGTIVDSRGVRAQCQIDQEVYCHQFPTPAYGAPDRTDGTTTLAVAGLGGLGHLAVTFAAALGAEVTVLSRTADKADDARDLAVTELPLTTDAGQMAQATGRFDLIVDTVSADHDLASCIRLLGVGGNITVRGYYGHLTAAVGDLTKSRGSPRTRRRPLPVRARPGRSRLSGLRDA